MPVARKEIGIARFAAGQSNPRITEYHQHTNIRGYDDKVAWCSSFADWCMRQAGIAGTGSALARSWLEWGAALQQPRPGCVVVVTRDDPASWKGHVGFYLRSDAEFIYLLGGNQLDEVREHFYPLDSVLGYRWPEPSSMSSISSPDGA
ncbi:TIGR02594 family protein [Undibacterium sp. TJN25]|uniref:TIGR02594 family protein n=1 Tax=Undibacterium sp. TJN25 TaxID=3413056 RepID=UPI003BF2B2F0